MTQREIERLANTAPLECRSTAKGKPAVIEGYASVFNSPSQPMGPQGFVEIVDPSFHNKQKADNAFQNIIAKYDHRSDFLLGKVSAGNVEVEVRSGGLWYAVHLNLESRSGADVWGWVQQKILTGSSFAFVAFSDNWGWSNGHPTRTLLSGRTTDIGPTSTPAYEQSSVSALRSLARQVEASFDEVHADYQNGTLDRYFIRTDQHITAAPTVLPGEHRSDPAAAEGELELRRRRNALRARECGYDPADPGQRLLEHYRRKLQWDAPVSEARSNPWYQVT
jgi:uncharacterized protein